MVFSFGFGVALGRNAFHNIVAHFRTRFWESRKLYKIVSQRRWDHEFCVTDNQCFLGKSVPKITTLFFWEIQNFLGSKQVLGSKLRPPGWSRAEILM